jgi:hypothetical protein
MLSKLFPFALLLAAACGSREPIPQPPVTSGVTLYGVDIHYFQGERLATVGRMSKLTYQRFNHDFLGEESDLKFPSADSKDHQERTTGPSARQPVPTSMESPEPQKVPTRFKSWVNSTQLTPGNSSFGCATRNTRSPTTL